MKKISRFPYIGCARYYDLPNFLSCTLTIGLVKKGKQIKKLQDSLGIIVKDKVIIRTKNKVVNEISIYIL